MIQTILILILLERLQSCPYKNYDDNILPQGDFTQISKFKLEEQDKFSFSFNFWIQIVNHFSPHAFEYTEKEFNIEKTQNGQIIFRLYEGHQLRMIIYKIHIFEEIDQHELIRSVVYLDSQSSIFQYKSSFSKLLPFRDLRDWIMILITIISNNGQIVIEMSNQQEENQVQQLLDNFYLQSNFQIVLGGHCFINDELNFNIFRGRITKLNFISPILWTPFVLSDLNMLCSVPDKIIQQFKDQTFENNPCHPQCQTCRKNPLIKQKKSQYCTSCDESLNRNLSENDCRCQKLTQSITTKLSQVGLCVSQYIYNPQISIIEVPISQTSCQFGQFAINLVDQTICAFCPNYSDNIVCLECLEQMDSWQFKPVCKTDFLLSQPYQQFQYQSRLRFNFDVYLIDDYNKLYYLNGVEDYCDEDLLEDTCFQSSLSHLKGKPYLKCKKGFQPANGLCIFNEEEHDEKIIECLSGQYYFKGNCLSCPIGCNQCKYFIDSNILQCLTCQTSFVLESNQCKKCGENCQKCIPYDNQHNEKSYLKCIKCIDDSKFIFSFDGVNCEEKKIKNCQYSFFVHKNDLSRSTLDYDFIPELNKNEIKEYCAKCDDFHVFNLQTLVCTLLESGNCLYGVADKIAEGSLGQQLINFKCLQYSQPDNNKAWLKQYEFEDCSQYIENCLYCSSKLFFQQCIICFKGYYKSRINGKCYKCDLDVCSACIQQDKYEEDGWKENLRYFYQQYIGKTYPNLNLRLFSFPSDAVNLEIICIQCEEFSQIRLIQGKCLLECQSSFSGDICYIINNRYFCIQCMPIKYQSNIEQSKDPLFICDENCKACKMKTQSELSQINPFYQVGKPNEQYTQIFKCYKPTNIQENFYDKEIDRFIECKIYKNGCEWQIIIEQNFICELLEPQFYKFSMNTFIHYFRLYEIKTVIFKIGSSEPLFCKINKIVLLESDYSVYILTLINLELDFNFSHKIIWEIENNVIFQNFRKVRINGLQIKIISNENLKILKFTSLNLQAISLMNCIIYSESNSAIKFQMEFFNSTQISFNNFTLNNILLNNQKGIFIFHSELPKQILINGMALINCQFQFSNIFDFQQNTNSVYIELCLVIRNSNFHHSEIFSNKSEQQQSGVLYIHDFEFLNSDIINTLGFIKSSNFLNLKIYSVTFQNSRIINSNFLQLNSISVIHNFLLVYTNFFGTSNLILAKPQKSLINPTKHIFFNMTFKENFYSANAKFLNLNKLTSSFSNVTITSLYLFNNTLNWKLDKIFSLNLQNTLNFIEADFVFLKDFHIVRANGLMDFSITNSKTLQIINSSITQSDDYKFFGLHEHFDCVSPYIKGTVYSTSIFIYSAQSIQIIQMNIFQAQTINYPLIYYESNYIIAQSQKEQFYLKQLTVYSNLIIQTQIEASVALFMFLSTQEAQIIIENCTFSDNILKFYSIELSDSALIFKFNMQFASVMITDCQFNSNLALNTQNSIISIKSESIMIANSSYTHNNHFQYRIIKPYMLWVGDVDEQVYLEDLVNIFTILSISGNGEYQAEIIRINSSFFRNSQGTKGAGLYISYQKACSIILESLTFQNIIFNLYDFSDQGSIIFISGFKDSYLNLIIKNIYANNSYSNTQGGLIYLSAKQNNILFELENVQLFDVYATTGSLIYFPADQQDRTSQDFIFNNISISNSDTGLKQFLIYFIYRYNSSDAFDLNRFIQGRNIIHVEKISRLTAFSIFFKNLILESPLYLVNVQRMTLSKIEIRDSIITLRAIHIQPISCTNQFKIDLTGYFVIESSTFLNLTISSQIAIQYLHDLPNKIGYFSIKCKTKLVAPESLSYKNQVNFSDFLLNITFKNTESQFIEPQIGMILFNELNIEHQISFDNNEFQYIDCSECTIGIVYVSFLKSTQPNKKQQISNLIIRNSSCGQNGCLKIQGQYIQNNSINQITNISLNQNIEFFLSNYFCQFNSAINGTCLNVQNINVLIQNSQFKSNIAQKAGGSVYIQQSNLKEQVIFQGTIIRSNKAQIGGGIYSNSQINLNFQRLDSLIDSNRAEFFADDVAVLPSKLTIEVNEVQRDLFEIVTLNQNDTYKLELFKLKNITNLHGINTTNYIFPSGVEISKYQYFNWKNRTYIPMNFKLRIKALTEDGVEIKDLQNSYCNIRSAINSLKNQENIDFTNNYTNFHTVFFNEDTLDYNLDDIIIYFQNTEKEQNALLLEFWCNSIFVPKYNKNYPYNLIQQHNSYHLRMLITTFPCQLGEIQNETFSSCQTCDANKGFFSFNINSFRCEIRNEISTKEVKPAQLNLKAKFWRPYFDSSETSECENNIENCLGGWIEGDNSCINGHIGALCEQCDVDNIRGNGHYFQNAQYSCSSCIQKREQEIYAIFGTIWALITITISALGSIQSSTDYLQAIKLRIIGFRIIIKHKPQSILIKIITNYLQILSVLTSFQIQYNNKAQTVFYSTTFILPYSLSCYLNGSSNTEYMYQMQIWQLLLPFVYMSFFLIFYGIGYLLKKIRFNISVITTVGLYLFIYFQPVIIRNLLSMISYRYISGYYWVSANVSYRYDREHHFFWIYTFCSPVLFLFGLLIPFVISCKLLQNRNKLEDQKVASMLGYLYNDYNRKSYFWEIFKIIQKEFLIFFIIFYEDYFLLKCCFIILQMTVYSLLNLHFKPFHFDSFNSLDYKSGKFASFSFILLIGMYQSENQQIYFINNIFFALLIIINSNFIGQLIIHLLSILRIKQKLLSWLKLIKVRIQKRHPNFVKRFIWFAQREEEQYRIKFYYQLLKQHLRKTAIANINKRKQIFQSIQSSN